MKSLLDRIFVKTRIARLDESLHIKFMILPVMRSGLVYFFMIMIEPASTKVLLLRLKTKQVMRRQTTLLQKESHAMVRRMIARAEVSFHSYQGVSLYGGIPQAHHQFLKLRNLHRV